MSKKFEYKYIAPSEKERQEIEHIQQQYLDLNKHSKIDTLRQLDKKVKNIPTCISIILGVIGILTFGSGLAMILEWKLIILGSIVSLIGCIPMTLSHFVYTKIHKKFKLKYRDEILKISNELLNKKD